MSNTIKHHDASGADYVEIQVEPPGGAGTLLLRMGDWTARLDLAVGLGQTESGSVQHVIEVAAFEVPDGKVDGDLLPPSQAGLAESDEHGDPVAVFLFDDEEDPE